jgi:transposase
MRGTKSVQQEDMFSYVSMEDAIPASHPLRRIKEFVEPILEEMWPDFDGLYSSTGRPSIPPEQLLKALLIQVLYTIRSETQLVEQLHYNLLYRWFVGLGMSGSVWERSTFSKNRERLIAGEIADRFFALVVTLAESKGLVSKEHFSVDGSVVEAWASLKSFQKKEDKASSDSDKKDSGGSNPDVDFRGEKRTNKTHESSTDPESRIYKKGVQSARMSYLGHVMMENRNGIAVDARVTQAHGTAEVDSAVEMASALKVGTTIGADKGYDSDKTTRDLREMGITSHAAQNINLGRFSSLIDGRTTRHGGYEVSQRKRKRIEEIFGWLKTIGLQRRPMYRGKSKIDWAFTFALAIYDLVRIKNLCPA